jgi:glutamyl-tRNA(Gln) amidotransferase subunit E
MAPFRGAGRVKAGLEVHQQLAVGKLFCACPSELSEETHGEFVRRLRSASGENLQVDAAAALQASRGLTYRYEISENSCLVEADEEPPHALNPSALDVALTLALLLEARVVDEVEVMRKIVVDGSNTSGFQRTALVALDGHLDVGGRRISILSICLEEDAARKVRESADEVTYRLDRLGIPLVEIATGPDIGSGREAREVAEEIGALLRSSRRVRRGIGTIREDLNVSAEGGTRIEVKGVQELGMIATYVDREVGRQEVLLRVAGELKARGATAPAEEWVDASSWIGTPSTGPFSGAHRRGGPVLALRLPGFAGLLTSRTGEEERLGRELADQARSVGLRGLIHSDELPGYGLDATAVARLRTGLKAGATDAFVLVTDPDVARAGAAMRRVARRATAALEGVPGETRDPLPDGRTRYSRPLPGRDRMYPETDVIPIRITAEHLARLREHLPERPAALRQRLENSTGLDPEVVRQLVASDVLDDFEALTSKGFPAALVARLLIQDVPSVPHPEGRTPFEPARTVLEEILDGERSGLYSKEGFPPILARLAEGAPDVRTAAARAGLGEFGPAELEALVNRIVASNSELVRSRGMSAFSALMGDVMREVRGRRDGQEVAATLRRAIEHQLPGGSG